MDRVMRSTCRLLLRRCREADRHPEHLVALLGRPPRRFDASQQRVVRMHADSSPFLEDAVWEACGGYTEFSHPTPRAAARAVRRHCKRAADLGLPYRQEAFEFLERLESARSIAIGAIAPQPLSPDEGRGNGFHAQASKHGSHVRLSSRLLSSAPGPVVRNYGTRDLLVGDVLLAHPMSCLFESFFDQSVVLLTDVDSTAQQVSGVVVNKPTSVTLQQMLERWPNVEDKEWVNSLALGPILANRLFRGGPVITVEALRKTLQWLHAYGEDVMGARKVAPGLWMGGDLAEVARRAASEPGRVRLLLGHAGWRLVQLRMELECGVWVHARTHDERGPPLLHDLCLGTGTAVERSVAWRTALQDAGQSALANFPRSEERDRRLRRHVDRFFRARERVSEDAGETATKEEREAGGHPTKVKDRSSRRLISGARTKRR